MLLVYFIIFLVVLFAPDFYIWPHYIAPARGVWAGCLYFAPTATALLAFVAARLGFYHNTCMRLFFAMVLCWMLPKLLFVLIAPLAGWQLALCADSVLVAVLLYGFFFGWRRIVVRQAKCASADVPQAFDGYRILQLSDLHVGTFMRNPSFIKKLVCMVNDQKADLVVFTGDLVNVQAGEVRPFMRYLSLLQAADGVYSVMGNHDYCEYGQNHSESYIERNQHVLIYLEGKMGWRLLMNENVKLTRNGQSIYLVGVENIGKPPFKSHGNLQKALEGVPTDTFKVLLSHDPTHWRHGVLQNTDIQLTLSGHTHAGQFKIGRFSPAKWAYNEWGGMYTEGKRMLHVSLGLGGTVPFRFGAWPEINVITLKRI